MRYHLEGIPIIVPFDTDIFDGLVIDVLEELGLELIGRLLNFAGHRDA